MQDVDRRSRRFCDRDGALDGDDLGNDWSALAEVLNRPLALSHQGVLRLRHNRKVFAVQHTQDTRLARRFERLIPTDGMLIKRSSRKKVFAGADEPAGCKFVKHGAGKWRRII